MATSVIFTQKMKSQGRFVIPKQGREELNLKIGDEITFIASRTEKATI